MHSCGISNKNNIKRKPYNIHTTSAVFVLRDNTANINNISFKVAISWKSLIILFI